MVGAQATESVLFIGGFLDNGQRLDTIHGLRWPEGQSRPERTWKLLPPKLAKPRKDFYADFLQKPEEYFCYG